MMVISRLLHRNDAIVYNNFLTFERSSSDDCRIKHYCTNGSFRTNRI